MVPWASGIEHLSQLMATVLSTEILSHELHPIQIGRNAAKAIVFHLGTCILGAGCKGTHYEADWTPVDHEEMPYFVPFVDAALFRRLTCSPPNRILPLAVGHRFHRDVLILDELP